MDTKRFIIIHAASRRIVATCGGTHRSMERICDWLDGRHPGTYLYDDFVARGDYSPQIGPNISLRGIVR